MCRNHIILNEAGCILNENMMPDVTIMVLEPTIDTSTMIKIDVAPSHGFMYGTMVGGFNIPDVCIRRIKHERCTSSYIYIYVYIYIAVYYDQLEMSALYV
jgi:hypothetical protein